MYETSGGEESWCAHLFHSSLLFFPQRCMLLVNVHFKAFCAFNQHVGDSQPASPRDLLAAPPDSVGSSPRHILPVPSPSQGRPGRAGAGLPPEGPRPPETQTAGLGQGQTSARGGGGGVRPECVRTEPRQGQCGKEDSSPRPPKAGTFPDTREPHARSPGCRSVSRGIKR